MTKPSDLNAGEWAELFRMVSDAGLRTPCLVFRQSMMHHATVRGYLMSLPPCDPRLHHTQCAWEARVFLLGLIPWRVLMGSRDHASDLRFTEPEVDRILRSLRERLDAACA